MSLALIGFCFILIPGCLAHKYVLQLYMHVLYVFSYSGYGLVALFTGVDKHVRGLSKKFVEFVNKSISTSVDAFKLSHV